MNEVEELIETLQYVFDAWGCDYSIEEANVTYSEARALLARHSENDASKRALNNGKVRFGIFEQCENDEVKER